MTTIYVFQCWQDTNSGSNTTVEPFSFWWDSSGGGGGGFQPAWAMGARRSQVIGSGVM